MNRTSGSIARTTAFCLAAIAVVVTIAGLKGANFPSGAGSRTLRDAAHPAHAAKGAPASDGELLQACSRSVHLLENTGRDSYSGSNPAQQLSLEFTPDGVQLQHARERTHVRLTGYGYGARLRPTGKPELIARGNRIDYQYRDITEWYINDSRGLEHGFTLNQRPAGALNGESLVITLAVTGEFHPRMAQAGDVVLADREGRASLRYSGLRAFDREGHTMPSHMEVCGQAIRLIVDDASAKYPLVVDPTWTQEAELQSSNGAPGDFFGYAVSVSGDTAVVGAPYKNGAQGAAYVFVRSGVTWTEQAKLIASDGAADDKFGYSIGISGDTLVVGAHDKNNSQGAAYVFERSGATWTEVQKLTASDGIALDNFGYSAAVSGNMVVVGANAKKIGSNFSQGAVYVFVRGTTWTQAQKLIASDGLAGDQFGQSVSISGATVAVGAAFKKIGTNANQGAAYVFEADAANTCVNTTSNLTFDGGTAGPASATLVRTGTTWTQTQELTAAGGAAGDNFGFSISVSGDTALVGARGSNSQQGSAYVFLRSNGTWSLQQKLTATGGLAGEFFGAAVAVSGDTAVIGAAQKKVGANLGQGAAYAFLRSGTTWTQVVAPLIASDGAAGDAFGTSVAVSGDTAVIGAMIKQVGANLNQGAVYVFRNASGQPTLTKWFDPAYIPVGGTITLKFNITNPNPSPISGLAFTDPLPCGLIVASPNAAIDTCNGSTVTAVAGSSVVTMTAGTLPPNSSCGLSMNVVNEAFLPKIAKSFTPSAIAPGGTSRLTFTITNTNLSAGFTNVGFTDPLPAGMFVANPSGLTGICNAGIISAGVGSTTIGLQAATLPALTLCTFSVNVTAGTTGVRNNVTSQVTSNNGPGNSASATLTVALAPLLTATFVPDAVPLNTSSALTFKITNANTNVTLTGIAFTDILPVGLVITSPANVNGSCGGGTITAVPSSHSVSLSGASLGSSQSCTFSVDVTGVGVGPQQITTSAITATNGPNGQPASATLTVGLPLDAFQVRYAANLDAGDSVIDLVNTGTLTLPTGQSTTGNICANIYTHDADEELISCCSCLVTPNGLNSLSARNDLISNTLTPSTPRSLIIKLVASTPLSTGPNGTGGSCNPSSPTLTLPGPGLSGTLVPGLLAWGTTIHALPTNPVTYGVTESRFEPSPLSPAELGRLTLLCSFILNNGSGFGICKSCRTGGLSGSGR